MKQKPLVITITAGITLATIAHIIYWQTRDARTREKEPISRILRWLIQQK
ncbi:hypothetical protein C5L21_001303 [Leuconostoc citreum]|nr:hypothetical protein C5L21_001303 [Leuconostoc citreum]